MQSKINEREKEREYYEFKFVINGSVAGKQVKEKVLWIGPYKK